MDKYFHTSPLYTIVMQFAIFFGRKTYLCISEKEVINFMFSKP